jgi:type IV secretory pathway VirB3-like protein
MHEMFRSIIGVGVILCGFFLLIASVFVRDTDLSLAIVGAVLLVYALVAVFNPKKLSLAPLFIFKL